MVKINNPIKTNKEHEARLHPSSLSEWTLETNIANEIVNMFSDVFTDRYPQYFRRNLRLPFFNPFNIKNKRAFSEKLTPIEESKGGGWDTKVTIPEGYFRDARVLFIQFKKGNEIEGNDEPSSLFNFNIKKPNPYIDFEFNNDTNNSQHKALRKIKEAIIKEGKSADSVMYGFPRLTTKEQFYNLQNSILHHTSFISIDELDKIAPKGIDLGDKNPHHFRTDKEGNNKEVCSTIFRIENKNLTYDFLYEIILIKLSRIWNHLIESKRNFDIYPEILLVLADYLKLEPHFFDENIIKQSYLYEITKKYFKKNRDEYLKKLKEIGINNSENDEISQSLYNNISSFFKERIGEHININKDIPSRFSSQINSGFRVSFEEVPNDFSIIQIII